MRILASLNEQNHCSVRNSSRNLPLKDSMTAKLNQLQLDIALIGSSIECLARELGVLVGADRLQGTAQARNSSKAQVTQNAYTMLHQGQLQRRLIRA
jgi:hypothetical protein